MNDKLQDGMKFSNVLHAWKVSLPKFNFPLDKICTDRSDHHSKNLELICSYRYGSVLFILWGAEVDINANWKKKAF